MLKGVVGLRKKAEASITTPNGVKSTGSALLFRALPVLFISFLVLFAFTQA